MPASKLLAWGLAPAALIAQAPAPAPDATLAALLGEALARHPDLARGRALHAAEKERIPQASALPDPSLTLGMQNDGFKRLEIGRMETSYYQVMVSQPLPWPGKREARARVAALGAEAQGAALRRTELGLVADVSRAFVGLLLARDRLGLLERQGGFLERAEAITRARYEVGQGSQADLLRAQVERTRLQQTRLALAAEEAAFLAALNRLRGADPGTPLPTRGALQDLALPGGASEEAWLERAGRLSPELGQAQVGIRQAERSLELARLDRRPDFTVNAGLMPRGGFDPMWQVQFSVGLPLWSGRKQQRAVAEQEWRRQAQGSEAESVRALLAQRIRERSAQLDAARATLKIYREGLLVQSEASFQAALAQYESGRLPFLGALEALNGWVSDTSGMLQSLAQAHGLAIAMEEFNLGPAPPISATALGAPALGMGGAPEPAAKAPRKGAAGSDAASPMKSM